MNKPQRTTQQNAALHLYFTQVAAALAAAGYDMNVVLPPFVKITPTQENVKEFMWRPVQEALLSKRSTTNLTTAEIDEVYDVLNRFLGETFHVHVPFPSMTDLLHNQ